MAIIKKILILVFANTFFVTLNAQHLETIIQRKGGGECKEFAISSDGLLLAKINGGITSSEIEIWNTKTGQLLRTISTQSYLNGKHVFLNSITHVRFWKGSKSIVTGTVDGDHEIYDVATGKLIKTLKFKSYMDGVFAINEKTGVFVALHPLSLGRNQLIFCDLYSETIYDSVQLNVGAMTALEFSPEGDKIAIGTKQGSFHIIDLSTYNRTVRVDSVHPGPIEYIQWTSDNYLLTADDTSYWLFGFKNNKFVSNGSLKPGNRIVSSPVEDCYYEVGEEHIIKRAGNGIVQKKMGVDPDIVRQIEIDDKGKKLYILTDNFIKVWDMENILEKENRKIQSFIPALISTALPNKKSNHFRFIPSISSCIFQEGEKLIQKAIDTNLAPKNYLLDSENIESLLVTEHGNPYVSFENNLKAWQSEKEIYHKIENNDSILFLFPSSGKLATLVPKDSVLKIYDLKKDTHQKIVFKGYIECGAVSPNNQQFAIGGNKLYLVDATTLKYRTLYDPKKEDYIYEYGGAKLQMPMAGLYKQLCFSKNSQHLYAIDFLGQLKIWNLRTNAIDTILTINAKQMRLSPDGLRIFVTSRNQVLLISTANYKTEAQVAFLAKGDFIVSLSDNYYRASRNGAKAVAFTKGLQSSGFDQFDIVYNRPDLVVKKIGQPSVVMLESLQKVIKKRQKKLGFAENSDKTYNLEVPEIAVEKYNQLPTSTTKETFEFSVIAKDKNHPLISCNIFINGVPSFSKNGYDLSKMGTIEQRKSINFNCIVSLDDGKNLVEINCTNEKGIKSTMESFEIFYDAQKPLKPSLYFIGIGAGSYQSKENNLKYPEKDIDDISKLLAEKNTLFENVHITLLKNEAVTKKDIAELRKILLTSNINDQVIIYWSGHGVVTKDLDYYLATYNMDFEKPEKEGLEYTELENLLDSIPARKRILFIDACHSGELDKEDAILTTDTTTKVNEINSKGLRVTVTNSTNFSALLNEMFADTRRSSGANIISAAGGAEYALEGDKWANGVFTFALLQGLSEKKADLNKDGKILISELQSYLQEKVPELTKGRQKPTSRTENLVKDWRIW